MDLAVSAVTSCCYVVDCAADLVPAFYAVGSGGRRAAAAAAASAASVQAAASPEGGGNGYSSASPLDSGFSSRKWPISGGGWGTNLCSYQELIITGYVKLYLEKRG